MKSLLNQGLFYTVIEVIIGLCIIALFVSIFLDFMLYSRSEEVKKEKKSIVETGTMTLFFLAFYLIIKSRLGLIIITHDYMKKVLIILGTAAIVAGCIMNIRGRLNLGSNWSNQIKIYNEHKLVREGMYKIVRHPLYFSIILMFYGASIVYRNVISFLAVTVIFVPFMYYRASQEEVLLTRAFPDYEEYKKRTGMLFPKILIRKK